MFNYTADEDVDADYLRLSDKVVVRTEEISNFVLVDVDDFNCVVGVEGLSIGVDISWAELQERFAFPEGFPAEGVELNQKPLAQVSLES